MFSKYLLFHQLNIRLSSTSALLLLKLGGDIIYKLIISGDELASDKITDPFRPVYFKYLYQGHFYH